MTTDLWLYAAMSMLLLSTVFAIYGSYRLYRELERTRQALRWWRRYSWDRDLRG
jgi:hypothetical protein